MSDVTVIIPALNEEARIAQTIAAAFSSGAAEVIVSDGGSSDATIARAREAGAHVVEGHRIRARQLNAGAEAAMHEHLIFLHADTMLPDGAARLATEALLRFDFGGFHLRFAENDPRLRLAAVLINARTSLTRCPWGDQAQFIRRDRFLSTGGFHEMPLMEDYELAIRMKRTGTTVVLPSKVVTSGRRFLDRGFARTVALNWSIVIAWRFGVDPEKLARWYRGR